MTSAEIRRAIAEYPCVIRRARDEGWLGYLVQSHLLPCTQDQATQILRGIDLPNLKLAFVNQRGRARVRGGRYGISLPNQPGPGYKHLRVGVVLHEAAHIIDHRCRGRFGHGEPFCRRLRDLLLSFPWRRCVNTTCRSYREIYDRHRGPFSLMLMRSKTVKGKEVHESDRVRGPFKAEEAHEEARLLVGDQRDNVIQVWIWSETEQQHIGAYYERDTVIPAWENDIRMEDSDERRVELDPVRDEGALLSGREEPLQPGDAPAGPGQQEPAPGASQVARVRRVPGPAKRGTVLTLDQGNAERWPGSKAAGVVRDFLTDRQATAKEIIAATGPQLKELGVEFPASLVSRLKQGGFLKEATE